MTGGLPFASDPEAVGFDPEGLSRLGDTVSNAFRAQARTFTYAALTHPEK